MEMKCNDGCWEYTGQFNKDCGNCTFGGVHLVFPFDPLSNSPNATTLYRLGFTDYDYTMVQPYFDDAAEYGVKAHYHDGQTCQANHVEGNVDCINGTSYYEP